MFWPNILFWLETKRSWAKTQLIGLANEWVEFREGQRSASATNLLRNSNADAINMSFDYRRYSPPGQAFMSVAAYTLQFIATGVGKTSPPWLSPCLLACQMWWNICSIYTNTWQQWSWRQTYLTAFKCSTCSWKKLFFLIFLPSVRCLPHNHSSTRNSSKVIIVFPHTIRDKVDFFSRRID